MVTNHYLNVLDKEELVRMDNRLKTHRHARLEIDLRNPYGHRVANR